MFVLSARDITEEPESITGLRTGLPIELDRIVNKALAKNPDERYQYVVEMLVDLISSFFDWISSGAIG